MCMSIVYLSKAVGNVRTCSASHVQEIVGSSKAFAALMRDGTVKTWGDQSKGGDCSQVQEKLKDVTRASELMVIKNSSGMTIL